MSKRAFVWVLVAGCSSPMVEELTGPKPPVAAKSSLTFARDAGTYAADGNDQLIVNVTALDADGKPPVTSIVTLAMTGSGNLVGTPTNTNPQGVASGLLRSTVAETKTVTATVDFDGGSFTLSAPSPVTFVPGAIAELRWVQQPTNVVVNTVMTPPVRIQFYDVSGNLVTARPKTMRVRLNNSTSGAVLTGGDYRTSVDGGITFDMLMLDKTETGVALRAEEQGGGIASDSAQFNITP